jgi:hypothetical protein
MVWDPNGHDRWISSGMDERELSDVWIDSVRDRLYTPLMHPSLCRDLISFLYHYILRIHPASSRDPKGSVWLCEKERIDPALRLEDRRSKDSENPDERSSKDRGNPKDFLRIQRIFQESRPNIFFILCGSLKTPCRMSRPGSPHVVSPS